VVGKKHRGYSIDIEPSLFLASSMACECLKQADMDKYMDFHLVKSMLHLCKGQMKHVPLSKGKIFESSDLSLFEKKHLLNSLHKLMKIYQKWMEVEVDMNSTSEFDKDMVSIDETLYSDFLADLEGPFLPFIEKMVKKNRKIVDFLAYIICNYQYNYDRPLPEHAQRSYTLRGFIQKFGKFIKSCGVYGEIPYLYVDNGIGDIPQAFSRIASIYASVYILHPRVEVTAVNKISDDCFEITTNLSPDKPVTTKEVFFGPTHLDLRKGQEEFYEERILRVFMLVHKLGKEEQCPAICFLNELPGFVNPVYMFLFDSSSHSCPNDQIFYQFETIIGEETAEECQAKGAQLLDALEGVYGTDFKPAIKYYSVYIRTRRYPKKSLNNSEGVGLNDTMGIDLDQHFDNFVDIVGKQENYFKKENPNQEEIETFGDDAKYILEKIDELKINETPQPEETSDDKEDASKAE
jgi:RAB protein geranylgeranyltransferase component A